MNKFFCKIIIFSVLIISNKIYAVESSLLCKPLEKDLKVSFNLKIKKTTGLNTTSLEALILDQDNEDEIKEFFFRNGNLLLTTFDKFDESRLRRFVSVQLNSSTKKYEGQYYWDVGGFTNVEILSGPVECIDLKDIVHEFHLSPPL